MARRKMINPSEVFSRTAIQILLFYVKRIDKGDRDYATLKEIKAATHMSYPSVNETCKRLAKEKILTKKSSGTHLYKPNQDSKFIANFKTLLEMEEEKPANIIGHY